MAPIRRCNSEPTFNTDSDTQEDYGKLTESDSSRVRDNSDSDSSSRPTDQPNSSLSDCTYQTDDEFEMNAYRSSGERSDNKFTTHGSKRNKALGSATLRAGMNNPHTRAWSNPGPGYPFSMLEENGHQSANVQAQIPPSYKIGNLYDPQKTPKGNTRWEYLDTASTTPGSNDNMSSTDSGHELWSAQPQESTNSGQQRQDSFETGSFKVSPAGLDSADVDPAVLKSIGSEGHPSRCCECQFFFFSLTGCKKGQDCLYCHEFHPRAKEKKNRKLRRRLDEVGSKQEKLGLETGAHSFNGHKIATQPNSQIHNVGSAKSEKHAEGQKKQTTSTVPEDHVLVAPEQGVAMPTSNMLGGNVGNFTLMYPLGKRDFVFMVGQHVNLKPLLQSSEADESSKKDFLTYSVSPPLPAGLQLDVKTGAISGTVAEPGAYPGSMEHTIKVGVRVLAAWNNMVLGSLTLCEVRIKVRVVSMCDLQNQIRWIQEVPGGALRIEFNDVNYSDDCVPAYQ